MFDLISGCRKMIREIDDSVSLLTSRWFGMRELGAKAGWMWDDDEVLCHPGRRGYRRYRSG